MSEINSLSPYVRYVFCGKRGCQTWLSNETENLMLYVVSGSFIHEVNGRRVELSEGMLLMIPPYSNQVIGSLTSSEAAIFTISFDLFDTEEGRAVSRRCRDRHLPERELFFTRYHTLTLIEPEERPRVLSLMKYIREHFSDSSLHETLLVKSSMLELIAIFIASKPLDPCPMPSTASHYVSEALRYAEHNFSDPSLSVAAIAAHLGISTAHLSRLARRELGQSLSEYIVRIRIKKAKDLFAIGKRISETAELCGFISLQAFSRTFKRVTGVSPRKYLSHP